MRFIHFIFLMTISFHTFQTKGSLGEESQEGREMELELVLSSVYAASFDMDSYFHVVIGKIDEASGFSCSLVKAEYLKEKIWKHVLAFQSFYPDEALPYQEAKGQLSSIIGNSLYKACEEVIPKGSFNIIIQTYSSVKSNLMLTIEFEDFSSFFPKHNE